MKLHVYDFDGTLYKSPVPNFDRLGPKKCGRLKSSIQQGGLGWFQNPITLSPKYTTDIGIGFNEDILYSARSSIADENIMTVLLTGRTTEYHDRIIEICDTAGLVFDRVITKPLNGGHTFDFKTTTIEGICNEFRITNIELWDDRKNHVSRFTSYFNAHSMINAKVNLVEDADSTLPADLEDELYQYLYDNAPDANKSYEYMAVVLDSASMDELKKLYGDVVPSDWKWYGHHVTMIHSSAFKKFPEIKSFAISNKDMPVIIACNQIGKSDDVIALRVSVGVPVANEIPHITLGTAPKKNPVLSNDIVEWEPLNEPLILNGAIKLMEYSSK